MESMLEPFTAELTIQPGAVVEGSARNGFSESIVTLRAPRQGGLGSGTADLCWGADILATGTSTATFLDNFWNGDPVAHIDALDFGRRLLGRLLGHPDVLDRWRHIQSLRGARPLRLELILRSAEQSPISAVPFELLADERAFLFYAGRSSLVRCIWDLDPRRATLRPRDRLLVAWANPTDIEPRIEDQVFQEHEASVAQAARAAGLDVPAPVERTGFAGLQDALAAHRPVPVVSLVAHGYAGGGRVAFENADRTSEPVAASSIAAALQGAETQVALLWSCHAARHHADLGSLAELLLRPTGGNLAAVLAAHGAVRANWTPRAARRIFEALRAGTGNDLERAVTYARQTLGEEDPQWAALAYHARPVDGRSVTKEDAALASVAALTDAAPRTDRVEGIPQPPVHWVDRPAEVGEIAALVASSRLVTVRGMPGIGKTQLTRAAAVQMIADTAFSFESALWIALDDLRTVDDLRDRIAAWAGLHERDVPDWRLARAIGARRALWALDNAEDLIRTNGAGLRSFLDGVIMTCPGIQLVITSQRPLGDLPGAREDSYVVHRIENPDTCRQLFNAAASNRLGDRIHGDEVRALLELLDGHPRSLVLVAGQVREGGANLQSILTRLRERGDEAVLAAELLESGTDWTRPDRLRAEHLVSSLHLAYRPLREHAPGAGELFAWLGTLPAGLPIAMAGAIFGEDAPERIAILRRFSLVEFRGADERLELPAPVRWYAEHRLEADVPAERQAELLARTLDAIASLWAAAYGRLGKPGFGAVVDASRRESLNLESLLRRVEPRVSAAPDLALLVARAFWRWSEVRIFGGRNAQQASLIERARALVAPLHGAGMDHAGLVSALGDLYLRTDRLADAEAAYTQALAAFTAIDARIGEANTRRALGDLYFRTDRLADAEAAYTQALAAFAAIDERLGEANTRKALGDLYLRAARLADAEAAYTQALASFTAIDHHLGEANTRRALGDLYRRTERLADAEAAYTQALAAFAAIDERVGEANTTSALGQLAVARRRLAEGFERFRAARTMFLAVGERLGAAGQLGYMARVAQSTRLDDRAIVLGGMAWAEHRAINDRFGAMLAAEDLVQAAAEAGDERLLACALLLTWQVARSVDPPRAARLIEHVRSLLSPEKVEAGLDPDDIAIFERQLAAATTEVAARLEAAGEDPFGPLIPVQPEPP